MRQIDSTDARSGPHGEGLGKQHAGLSLHVQQSPDGALFGMVRARRVARGGPYATIFFLNQFFVREAFRAALMPNGNVMPGVLILLHILLAITE